MTDVLIHISIIDQALAILLFPDNNLLGIYKNPNCGTMSSFQPCKWSSYLFSRASIDILGFLLTFHFLAFTYDPLEKTEYDPDAISILA